ncbi:porin [Microvirga sp. BT688]|uniref:porin n=1 Tax=Microvirga sp. TaxID=1873136 RepID=UPI0016860530|nr:porin [Microvirga sp.]MBD2749578.1 porin [Microvirga sp.]
MKLAKSLFLGSVAGLAAVAGAQAADLPVKKAAAVEYVRVCSTYGAGFFYIPGTETCLRVAGRVRAEYQYLEPQFREDNAIGFRARGRVQLDARTATAYGLLRTFIRMEMDRNTGVYNSQVGAGASGISPNIAQAYIQFGGLTAGRTTSFFANGDLPNGNITTLRFYDYPDVNLLAYTFSFGNGFSATLSLEEGAFAGNRLGGFNPVTGAPLTSTAGQRWPDLVGNVKYAGTWGSVQLSGALHESRASAFDPIDADFIDSELGWAVGLQAGLNLPALGAGDALWFAAAYADGALNYLGFGPTVTGVGASGSLRGFAVPDAFIGADGDVETASGWQVAGGLRHYWAPTLRSNIHGSYASVDFDSDAVGAAFLPDFDEWRVGVNTFWSPVSGLDIGVEVLYANIDVDSVDLENEDRWEARFRVQRDF